jgi:hypothetical protein
MGEPEVEDGGTAMTLGKKLYLNFGGVLLGVVFLFVVNFVAVQREHGAKNAAKASLDVAEATDQVRFQMMLNRLYLSNYLLSGDTRQAREISRARRFRPAESSSREGPTAGAELGQRVCSAPGGQAQGCGQRQRHSGRAADFLSAEGRLGVGEEFHRVPGYC